MPFAYYGAKARVARYYPKPKHNTIIEPFAGSAAYSMFHIHNAKQIILIEKDEAVVNLWHRLQNMTSDELDKLDEELNKERTTEPLIAGLGGGTSLHATLSGKSRQLTPWMKTKWPQKKNVIKRALPYLHKIEVHCGDYTEAPRIEATYFIDPPYQLNIVNPNRGLQDQAGNGYRHGSQHINYQQLAKWCEQLPGQTIVCEQKPANWLPFEPFRANNNINLQKRTEVIWTNETTDTAEQLTIC
jgi:site-specific DNA-adenine methylase